MLHSLNYLCDPSLNVLRYVPLVLRSAELDTALKMQCHRCLTREEQPFPLIYWQCLWCCWPSFLYVHLAGPWSTFCPAGALDLFLQSCFPGILVHRVNLHPLQDLAFPFVELYEVHEQELAHFSSLTTSLWMATYPSGLSTTPLNKLYCLQTCWGCTLSA